MSQPEQRRYERILNGLLKEIGDRSGEEHVIELKEKLHDVTQEGVNREVILQVLAEEPFSVRFRFIIKHLTLLVPYLCRIKRT